MSHASVARTAVLLALVVAVAASPAVAPVAGSASTAAVAFDSAADNETDDDGLVGSLDVPDAALSIDATAGENASVAGTATVDGDATVDTNASVDGNATTDATTSVDATATAGENDSGLGVDADVGTEDTSVDAGVDAGGESVDAGTAVDGVTNVTVETAVDGPTSVDGTATVHSATATDGALALAANATVGDLDGAALALETQVGGLLDPDLATSVLLATSDGASGGIQSAPEDETSGEDGDDAESGGAGQGDPGSNDGDGGAPVPDDLGTGLAVGSLAVGAGLAARRATTVAGASAGAGGGATLSTAVELLRAWGWRLAGLAGYQRFDDTDPLEHETRAAVYEHLQDEPGAFLSEIGEAADVPLSTLRYHLRILAFENLVTDAEVRGKRRFFPADVDPDALETALEDDATAAVLEALAREPDSVSGLAERLERDPSTVSHHLQRLDDEGLVERERDGRSVVNRLADGLDVDRVATGGRVASSAD